MNHCVDIAGSVCVFYDRQTNWLPYQLSILFDLLQQTGRQKEKKTPCLPDFRSSLICHAAGMWFVPKPLHVCPGLFPVSPPIIPPPLAGSPFELKPHWERGNPALVPLALGVPWAAVLGCVTWQDACSLATDTRKHAPTACLASSQTPTPPPPALHTLTSGVLAAAGLLFTKSLKADGWMLCSWWKSWLPPLQPTQNFPIGRN